MSEQEEEYYSDERWQNWLDRLKDEDLDPEEEDSARLLLNLQDDVAIAVAKIVTDYEDGDLGDEEALDELASIRETVLAEPDIEDEDTLMLVDGVQTSLVVVFYSSEQYVADGVADESDVTGYVQAAADAEAEEEFDRALGLAACAGTRIIDGEELPMELVDELEYGLVVEWVNGLDSLQSAFAQPEVVEED